MLLVKILQFLVSFFEPEDEIDRLLREKQERLEQKIREKGNDSNNP